MTTVRIILAVVFVAALVPPLWRWVRRPDRVAEITNLRDRTEMDASGAVLSIQSADIDLPTRALEGIWSPRDLERLARTYWRFLTRATFGLIRVSYTERERFVVLLMRPFVLLRFQAPEYEMDATRGIVRWRIEKGLLVSPRGRGGAGWLQIDVQRRDSPAPGRGRLHVEVEVRNFYPNIARTLTRFAYKNTQSRIHVIVTYSFLRSLARLDLADSRVGRFAAIEDVPNPPAQGRRGSPAREA